MLSSPILLSNSWEEGSPILSLQLTLWIYVFLHDYTNVSEPLVGD